MPLLTSQVIKWLCRYHFVIVVLFFLSFPMPPPHPRLHPRRPPSTLWTFPTPGDSAPPTSLRLSQQALTWIVGRTHGSYRSGQRYYCARHASTGTKEAAACPTPVTATALSPCKTATCPPPTPPRCPPRRRQRPCRPRATC